MCINVLKILRKRINHIKENKTGYDEKKNKNK